jgi:hypothetical protein
LRPRRRAQRKIPNPDAPLRGRVRPGRLVDRSLQIAATFG